MIKVLLSLWKIFFFIYPYNNQRAPIALVKWWYSCCPLRTVKLIDENGNSDHDLSNFLGLRSRYLNSLLRPKKHMFLQWMMRPLTHNLRKLVTGEISLSMDLSMDVISRVYATIFVAIIVVCLQGRVSDWCLCIIWNHISMYNARAIGALALFY